jgi:hypothetical protein
VVTSVLVVVGLGFALLGQFYFVYRREYVWDGVFFWCVAVLSLGLFLWWLDRGRWGRSGQLLGWWTSGHSLQALAAIGGTWLALLSGWLARQRPGPVGFSSLLWLWLVGVACFLWSMVAPRNLNPLLFFSVRPHWAYSSHLSHWLRSHQIELAGLAVLLLVALVVRAADLEHIPANLGGDEGEQGMAALELLGPPLDNPFSTGWFSVPTMSFLAWGVSMRVFGESIAGLRALSALIGTCSVLTTFLLARELWGQRVAWLAAAALTCSHFHIHFSRLGSNQIADGLLTTLALWLLVRGLRSRRAITFALAGAVMGLGWYGYFGARLIGFLVVPYLAWRSLVEHRFFLRYGQLMLILLWAALVVAAPLLFHYADYPDELSSRARQVSIFASGWLAREQEITGRSGASLMLQQFWKSISAFNYTLDPTFWYHSSIPLLDFISGVLFVLGLVWATVRCRWPANGLLLLWFWLALILGWVATENPPSSMRLTGIAPALASLVGLGLNWLVALSQHMPGSLTHLSSTRPELAPGGGGRVTSGRRSVPGAMVSLLVAIAVLNLYYYFVVYIPTRVYGNPTSEVATELGRYLVQQDDDYVVYFHAPPFMYWDFGTLRFIARGIVGRDVPLPVPGQEVQLGEFLGTDLRWGVRFVFLPERLSELEAVRTQVPGGVELPVYSDADERLLYVLYEAAPLAIQGNDR